MIAGMTTERDVTTHLRWVRTPPLDPLGLDELSYPDGELVRPGDVVRVQLGPARSEPPYVENVLLDTQAEPLQRVRRLSGERRAAFFRDYLDPAPMEVLKERKRSLCLVRPDYLTAIVSFDEEESEFKAELALQIGRLRSKEDIAVEDIYWRAMMRSRLGDEEFMEVDDAELRAELGEIYLVAAIVPRSVAILGVHTVPEYEVAVDPDAL